MLYIRLRDTLFRLLMTLLRVDWRHRKVSKTNKQNTFRLKEFHRNSNNISLYLCSS